MSRSLYLICNLIIALLIPQNASGQYVKMKGVTLVASPNPVPEGSFLPIQNVCADWVALNPFAFSNSERSTRIIYDSPRQWWGERPDGIRDAIVKAKSAGMKVMLKPQLWIPGGWVGNVSFTDEEKWNEWAENYQGYILLMAAIAEELDVDLFCIGTELDQTVIQKPEIWRGLIESVRAVYSGRLTYAANWTHYDEIEIWPQLDFIGIDAYFPLIDAVTPTVDELKGAWDHKLSNIQTLSEKLDKRVLFTEFGYLSVDGCAHEHWLLEPKRDLTATNETAQANAYRALLETFMPLDWWAGCFLWKWYPDRKSSWGEGSWEKDYTPQGKAAETVLKSIFEHY
jgi:hypothetical protein